MQELNKEQFFEGQAPSAPLYHRQRLGIVQNPERLLKRWQIQFRSPLGRKQFSVRGFLKKRLQVGLENATDLTVTQALRGRIYRKYSSLDLEWL
jgi:hypothetical protein